MTEILKCRSCGYVGPWKECCNSMNFGSPTAEEAWVAALSWQSQNHVEAMKRIAGAPGGQADPVSHLADAAKKLEQIAEAGAKVMGDHVRGHLMDIAITLRSFAVPKKVQKRQFITFSLDVKIDDVVDSLAKLGFDEIIEIIKRLDKSCEDWGVTEKLHEYFSEEMDKLPDEDA